MACRSLLILEALHQSTQDKQTYHDPRLNANKQGEKTQTTDKFEESLIPKQGRIHSYPNRERMGRSSAGEGHQSIWAGAQRAQKRQKSN